MLTHTHSGLRWIALILLILAILNAFRWIKQALFRFYGMEHLVGMLAAIILVTIGYSKAKRSEAAIQKHTYTLRFYLLGFILILAFIPWPFRTSLGGSWF